MIPVFAVKKKAYQHDHRNRRPPVQFVGIETKNDKPYVGRDDRPACAVAGSALFGGREPEAVDKCPFNKGRDNLIQKKSTIRMVRMELKTPLNRFDFIHLTMPRC